MDNPNPSKITNSIWKLWTDRPDSTWRLGGIYADKPGYHNTVVTNLAKWPMNYSVRLPLDINNDFNRDKARAIDLTQSDASMVQWTTRMRDSALDPFDNRLAAVREFYGTLDNATVYGLIKDNLYGPWRKSSANLTHLFHGHTSVFTAFVNDWNMLSPILSVWSGETNTEWSFGHTMLPKQDEIGETVKYWQYIHNTVRDIVNPPCEEILVDGNYGTKTAAAFADFWKKRGGVGTYNGSTLTGWLAKEYHRVLVVKLTPSFKPQAPTDTQVLTAVDTWFANNMDKLPSKYFIQGEITAKATISNG